MEGGTDVRHTPAMRSALPDRSHERRRCPELSNAPFANWIGPKAARVSCHGPAPPWVHSRHIHGEEVAHVDSS
jgi:hypothetical protein